MSTITATMTPERESRAALSIITEPGDRAATALLRHFPAEEFMDALTDANHEHLGTMLIEAGVTDPGSEVRSRWAPRAANIRAAVDRALETAQRLGANLVIPGDEAWPKRLDDLEAPPIALWTLGDLALLNHDRPVAIVGARAATGYGEHVAMEMSAGLVARDCAVVSGGAYGIDGMAHRAALASGGKTIAYLAGGIDRFYPSGHEQLLKRIATEGLVATETAPGAAPTRWRFLARNRLIAAGSAATVVVEAGHRSGTLNTAQHAQTIGRPVGAVPGPITSAASAGSHALIKRGAAVITSPSDVLELAGFAPKIGWEG